MKRSQIKQHIIETASTLFYTNGYNLTGINEIIKEAGVAKATLYNHFGSKEEICLAYLQHKDANYQAEFQSFIQSHKKGKDRLFAFFYFLKNFCNKEGFNGCWFLNTEVEIPKDNVLIRNQILQKKHEFINFIQHLISENVPQNTSEEDYLLAQKIYLLYEGAINESKLLKNIWPIDAALATCKILLQ